MLSVLEKICIDAEQQQFGYNNREFLSLCIKVRLHRRQSIVEYLTMTKVCHFTPRRVFKDN